MCRYPSAKVPELKNKTNKQPERPRKDINQSELQFPLLKITMPMQIFETPRRSPSQNVADTSLPAAHYAALSQRNKQRFLLQKSGLVESPISKRSISLECSPFMDCSSSKFSLLNNQQQPLHGLIIAQLFIDFSNQNFSHEDIKYSNGFLKLQEQGKLELDQQLQ